MVCDTLEGWCFGASPFYLVAATIAHTLHLWEGAN